MRYGYNGRQGGIDMRSVVLDEEKAEYTVTSTPWSETCIVRLGESGK